MILSGGVQTSANEMRRSYDRAFKVAAVRLSREPGRTVAGTAQSNLTNTMPDSAHAYSMSRLDSGDIPKPHL